MHCPYCTFSDTKVIDSRLIAEGQQIRRRRECPECSERFTTFETAELLMPRVIKQKNNTREPFNEQKLREGLYRALEKRPVGEEEIETLIEDIKKDTIEIMLASKNGKWLGSGISDVREVEYVFDKNRIFSKKGEYKIRVEQAMRYGPKDKIENLEHILDIGLIVSEHHD